MKPYSGLAILGATISLSSVFYLGQSPRPYDLVGIKFCPQTANLPPRYDKDFSQRAQEKLNRRYCDYEHKLLKEIWTQKQFEAPRPLPESSLRIRDIPAVKSNVWWLLVAPISSGLAYLSWAKKSELDELSAHQELEAYKTCIKLSTVSSQNEREFKALQTTRAWDKQKVKQGFIPVEAIQDRARRQTELQDKTHAAALKQFDEATSKMDKAIAENLRDKHKADKESQKILGAKHTEEDEAITTTNKFELGEQYNWIYKLLKLPFRVLSGEQGSGKSTLERLMIRLLKDDGYHIVVINPETNPAVWEGVQVLADAESINNFIGVFPEDIRGRQQIARDLKIDEDDYLKHIADKSGSEGKVAIFLMEANTYEIHGVDPELWAAFLKQSLTNIRKWGYTVCLTAHSDNQTSISSKLAGFSKMIDSAPRVDCIAVADAKTGEATSSGKALLKMKGIKDENPVEVDLYNYPKSKKF
ncbi:hypothetical protein NIES2101_41295 [Calothrix sp. HK-06]|nr:hypothetical protein NIES2101_41295 [Calothrix sp. HK-06]